jgi:hypothetical protein
VSRWSGRGRTRRGTAGGERTGVVEHVVGPLGVGLLAQAHEEEQVGPVVVRGRHRTLALRAVPVVDVLPRVLLPGHKVLQRVLGLCHLYKSINGNRLIIIKLKSTNKMEDKSII